jgi:phage repressor protein C with HTH and peptisase S24 domain
MEQRSNINRKKQVTCVKVVDRVRAMSDVSPAAQGLKRLRNSIGLSMRATADALGWSLTRYQHYEDRYRRRYLPLELAEELARIFGRHGMPAASVLELAGVHATPAAPSSADSTALSVAHGIDSPPIDRLVALRRDLPVLGAVKGGSDAFYFNEGEPKEYVVRPPGLFGVSNGFALYVCGDSMVPRYYAGEILYVNPNRPPTRGCFVAVELVDGQGLIKQFIRRDDDLLVLAQFNPTKEIRLPAAQVKQIYLITGSGEAG